MGNSHGALCDVAIIGAGPYGLSLAAHLNALGVDFRIFGKAMDTWRNHVPKGMLLKSEGFASSLSSPEAGSRLEDYCTANRLPYADRGLPVHIDQFNGYASEFQKRFVPNLEERLVTSLTRSGEIFRLVLDDGERVEARRVVLAVGITHFAWTPDAIASLPGWAASHSFAHNDVARFAGKEVTVLGAGASAIDLAAALHDAGACVRVVARRHVIPFHSSPSDSDLSLLNQLRRPPTTIGPGWRSFLCVHAPLLFHRMPEQMRLRAVKNHLGPAPGWFMRERFESRIPALLGKALTRAEALDGRVTLGLVDRASGKELTMASDHVIAATGYRVDLTRLTFLSQSLRAAMDKVEGTPILNDQFESSVSGLFMTGVSAANSFGPMLRFMTGAEFAAPRLAAHLRRRVSTEPVRRAA
jgi:thioredoxin reductase